VRTLELDPVTLARYSAPTIGAHGLHPERPHASLVHGHVIAALLLEHLSACVAQHHPDRRVADFEFRAERPASEMQVLTLCVRVAPDGNRVALWAQDPAGSVCVDASATLVSRSSDAPLSAT
jgi:3-methylfumaryl-CoA hydratase